ncbi:MAG: leucine-rich repeat protein [Alphaproteobacteria bacterium]|nr:leucine-rich repeat protein [Alphaproteobacteria bacterium]
MKKSQFIIALMLGTSFATMARADDTSYANCVAAVGASNCVQIGTSGTYYALSGDAGNQTMTVYGTTESGSTAATVPEMAFFNSRYGKSTFPGGITSLKTSGNVNIGEGAFEKAKGLTSIDLTGVQTIGMSAFEGATGLTSVDLTGVQTIGEYAFRDATGLTSIDLTSVQTIGNGAFWGATGLTGHLDLSGVQTIGRSAFYEATGLTSVDLTGVQTIGGSAFLGAKGLTSIDLTGVQTIAGAVFRGDTGLTSIDLTGVQYIGSQAFASTDLSSVVIGGTPEIDEYAFDNLPSGAKLYCESLSVCQTIISTSERQVNNDWISLSECGDIVIQTFSKGDDGVYVLKDENGDPIAYYSSAANMMAGGTQEGCATQEFCAAVVLAANNPTPQPTKNADGSYTLYNADGTIKGYKGKRIYTIDEANAVAGKVNSVKIRYR